MLDIVPGIDPASIAASIEANINGYLLSFARLPGAVLHEGAESVWLDSGVANATLNSVVQASFQPDTLDAGIEAVLSHFRRHSRPFTWHVGPTTHPAELGLGLEARGMAHSEDEPGMAVELDGAREFEAPPELRIEPVRDERGLKEWVSVWLFPVLDELRRLHLDALLQRDMGEDLPWRYYLGRIDGKPVATSELFADAGVAGVQYVVTLPELRRRGIGTAMTAHALREARALGYRRIGFQEYCWFHRYEWEPENSSVDE